MRFYRIGDKIVSREKLSDAIDVLLVDREGGATQQEAADAHAVERSFISRLETLGEVRRGARVGLVAFPVANGDEIRRVAEKHGVEFTLVMSQAEREGLETGAADRLFNLVLDTLATLTDFDTVIVLASDWRVGTIERILGREVIAVTLGTSPLRHDVEVDIVELTSMLETITRSQR
jgi:hypothetical protein